jgi:hypothetical protein
VIILETSSGGTDISHLYEEEHYKNIQELKAIQEHRVYSIRWLTGNGDIQLELPIMLMIEAKGTYPEKFSDINISEWIEKYYMAIYNVSEDDAKNLQELQKLVWLMIAGSNGHCRRAKAPIPLSNQRHFGSFRRVDNGNGQAPDHKIVLASLIRPGDLGSIFLGVTLNGVMVMLFQHTVTRLANRYPRPPWRWARHCLALTILSPFEQSKKDSTSSSRNSTSVTRGSELGYLLNIEGYM